MRRSKKMSNDKKAPPPPQADGLQFKLPVKIFFKGKKTKKYPVNFSDNAWTALKEISTESDLSIQEIVEEVLEQYLQFEARNGAIEWPKDYKGD